MNKEQKKDINYRIELFIKKVLSIFPSWFLVTTILISIYIFVWLSDYDFCWKNRDLLDSLGIGFANCNLDYVNKIKGYIGSLVWVEILIFIIKAYVFKPKTAEQRKEDRLKNAPTQRDRDSAYRIVYNRCPSCNKKLGKYSASRCPYCTSPLP